MSLHLIRIISLKINQIHSFSCSLYTAIISHLLLVLKCDFTLVQSNLSQLECMCKASWEQLKLLEKTDEKKKLGKVEKKRGTNEEEDGGLTSEGSIRRRLPKFLKECEERLKVLRAVHRRVINRSVVKGLRQNNLSNMFSNLINFVKA